MGRHSSEDMSAETALLPVARPRPTWPAWLPRAGLLLLVLLVLIGGAVLVVSRSGGGRVTGDDAGGPLAAGSSSVGSSGSPSDGPPGSPAGSPSGSASASPGGKPSSRPSAAASAAAASAAPPPGLSVAFRKSDSWNDGYQAAYTITNHGTVPVSGWTVAVTFSGSGDFQWWDADAASGTNHQMIFTAKSYNSTVPAGGSVTFGLVVRGSPPPNPAACTVNGRSC